jgi:hypothetical protein
LEWFHFGFFFLDVGERECALLVVHVDWIRVDDQLGIDVARVAAVLVEAVFDENAIELGHAADLQRFGVLGRHVVALWHILVDPAHNLVRKLFCVF